jgi:hypothetical protein
MLTKRQQPQIDQERQERLERQRRADNYRARQWKQQVLRTGSYRGQRVPKSIRELMLERHLAHMLDDDLASYDVGGPLGSPVATFPYRPPEWEANANHERRLWAVYADGTLAIIVDPAYPDF